MDLKIPTREEALALLHQFNEGDSLRKHAYAVEGGHAFYCPQRGEDEEKVGIVGLIHDLDYEKFPDQHCRKTRENSCGEELAGGNISVPSSPTDGGICSDEEPQTNLEKALVCHRMNDGTCGDNRSGTAFQECSGCNNRSR